MNLLKWNIVEIACLAMCFLSAFKNASSLDCFQCDSTNERTCGESLPQHHSLGAGSCDHIQEATYCVKMTGVFEAEGIECYQCDSSKDLFCPDHFKERYHDTPETSVTSFSPKSCENVFEARYCIKTTGMFEGELGTKRFCSSRDWGNYCEWVRRPGDEREYRACVFTCGGHGCNKGESVANPSRTILSISAIISFVFHVIWIRQT